MKSAPSKFESVSGWSLWQDWMTANILGEAIGLAIPAGVAVLVAQRWDSASFSSMALGSLLLLVAGILEGAVVGVAQGLVLRRLVCRLRVTTWAACTAFGAGIAWAMGMLPGLLLGPDDFTVQGSRIVYPIWEYTAAAIMGCVVGAVLGVSQWWALRLHLRRALWWIPANAAAWTVGMPIVFVAAGSGGLSSSDWSSLALAGAALAIAGAVVGAVHGAVLVWMAHDNFGVEPSSPGSPRKRSRAMLLERFETLPLRTHALLAEVPLHWLGRLDLPGGDPGMTLHAISAVIGFDGAANMELGRTTEMLFKLRGAIGQLLDWDAPKPRFAAESYVRRLTAEDRSRSTIAPGMPAGISQILYEFEDELLGEIINRTVHCFWLLAAEKSELGYVLWLAVYVKKRNWFTPIYMAAVSPVLHAVIYPAMLRGAKKRWLEANHPHPGIAAVC